MTEKAEVALPLPEETKKVGELISYATLEMREIAAKFGPVLMGNLFDKIEETDDVDDMVKVLKEIVMPALGMKEKAQQENAGVQTIAFNINIGPGRKGAVVEATAIEVPDLDFDVALTDSMQSSLTINAEIDG